MLRDFNKNRLYAVDEPRNKKAFGLPNIKGLELTNVHPMRRQRTFELKLGSFYEFPHIYIHTPINFSISVPVPIFHFLPALLDLARFQISTRVKLT